MGATSLYARPSPGFANKLDHSRALIASAAQHYTPLTQASSLGAEDMVITHLLHEGGLDAEIFVLDTGMLHAQTLALVGRIEARYQRPITVYRPDETQAVRFVQAHGDTAMVQSLALRKECCHIRKMEPLARALTGKKGWLTGLRREQSSARAALAEIEPQAERTKINPLADWTEGDVWHFILQEAIPYNPLHDAFYPSIGCAPCTRAVTPGEDIRSGRWWWESESAKECGLHVAASTALPLLAPRLIPIQEIPA